MIESIHLHISDDEDIQTANEARMSEHITKTFKRNVAALTRIMPSLVNAAVNIEGTSKSLFCNKYGETNIVDYGEGKAFYGLHPYKECVAQVEAFLAGGLAIDKRSEKGVAEEGSDILLGLSSLAPVPQEVDVLVVFGIGLGYHLLELINRIDIKHLIIYEPDEQMFKCSVLNLDWQKLLNRAGEKNTAIYVQLGNNGSTLADDIEEISQVVEFSEFYVFKHYNTEVFNATVTTLFRDGWSGLKHGLNYLSKRHYSDFVPDWTGSQRVSQWQLLTKDERYQRNIAAFKQYIPDVYHSFKDYQPQTWLPVDENNMVNMVHSNHGVAWYSDSPKVINDEIYEGFCRHPRRDGLALGYNGKKLKHYIHYQFVSAAQDVVRKIEEQQHDLPDTVRSMIVFGIGSGYSFEQLVAKRSVEKLFVCEPNRDFFYASLFAIDWAAILQNIDESGGRIYLNVGDDGTHLFRDLLRQFYSIGPYLLAETYLFQGYYNASLNLALMQLREQLQVVIAMGEYFDHAYFGISHTLYSVRNEQRFLTRQAPFTLTSEQRQTPIFMVGNGPSIDASIDTIKEYQDKAIIISCGTALQVLHRYGITPDFHAEIEQNRSTYDWAKSIYDDEYLKNVDLMSCNGIHPDTAELYRNIFLAFKEGESSSISTMDVCPLKFEVLQYAHPTVCNFATNLFLTLGFEQVYLFGVDMGFKDKRKHHSKKSGYYLENGEEIYDYAEKENVAIKVPGNFSDSVYTKHEFKVAKISLESLLSKYKADCFNTADGAKIIGTKALPLDLVLPGGSPTLKQHTLASIRGEAFVSINVNAFDQAYTKQYKQDKLSAELAILTDLFAVEFDGTKHIEGQIEKQKMMLFDSYQNKQSLLFYFFYGSLNYYNAVLSNILAAGVDEDETVARCNEVRELWVDSFAQMAEKVQLRELEFDVSHSMARRRYYTCMQDSLKGLRLLVITNSVMFAKSMQKVCGSNQFPVDLLFASPEVLEHCSDEQLADRIPVLYLKQDLGHINPHDIEKYIDDKSLNKGIRVLNEYCQYHELQPLFRRWMVLMMPGDCMTAIEPLQTTDMSRAVLVFSYLRSVDYFNLVLSKYETIEDHPDAFPVTADYALVTDNLYDNNDSMAFATQQLSNNQLVLAGGYRGQRVNGPLTWQQLQLEEVTLERLETHRQYQTDTHHFLAEPDRLLEGVYETIS